MIDGGVVELTVDQLRARSRANLTSFDDATLGLWLQQALVYVEETTGRIPLTIVPERLASMAVQAWQMRTEQLAVWSSSAQAVSSAAEGITSYSVPGYSEQKSATPPGGQLSVRNANPWAALRDLLWLLMSDDAREDERMLQDKLYGPAIEFVDIEVEDSDLGVFWARWGY